MRNVGRKDSPSAVWHVTSRVNWRAWHLAPEEAARVFLQYLGESLDHFGMDLLAVVVMSNHYHAVLQSPDGDEYTRLTSRRTACRHLRKWPAGHPKATVIGQCARQFKLAVANRIQSRLELKGHFWEGRHHRRRIHDVWGLVTVVAYDHRNPVCAGMVALPEDYARSSAAWWSRGAKPPLPLCRRQGFPFGVSREAFRDQLLRFQADKRIDDVMEVFEKSRLPIDSLRGRTYLERLMERAGLDPLGGLRRNEPYPRARGKRGSDAAP